METKIESQKIRTQVRQKEGSQRRQAGPAAVAMTRGNQLARQKNMKKQSDSVKGKRRDDGLSAAARKQR